MARLPVIALLRPAAPSDPSLARDAHGRYLLPALLAGLVSSGLCSAAAAALPEDLDTDAARELKEALVLAGVQVILGPEAPQQRLADALERLGWPGAVALTAYAALLSGPDLTRAAKAVATGGVHAAWAEGVGPERFFFVCSRRAADVLANRAGAPLPPTAFPAMLEKSGLALAPLAGISTPAERFVTGARLAGEGRALPPELAAQVLDPAEPEAWFAPKRQRELLRRFSGVADWQALERALAPLHPNTLDRLAGQVRLFDSLVPHLPGWPKGPDGKARRGRFVELGAGALPLCALLLCEGFEQGLALEPFAQDAESLAQTRALARTLRTAWPGLIPWPEAETGQAADGGTGDGGRLVCEARRLEDLALPDAGVDLIYSRMTLEHVDDPAALSREMARVLAPGGVMLHRVDFRDHTGIVEQVTIHFDFLAHSPEEWRATGADTNLLRVNDFLDLWQGLGLCAEARERLLRRVPPARLHPCWSGYADEDLYCYNALLLARRQPATPGDEPCS